MPKQRYIQTTIACLLLAVIYKIKNNITIRFTYLEQLFWLPVYFDVHELKKTALYKIYEGSRDTLLIMKYIYPLRILAEYHSDYANWVLNVDVSQKMIIKYFHKIEDF